MPGTSWRTLVGAVLTLMRPTSSASAEPVKRSRIIPSESLPMPVGTARSGVSGPLREIVASKSSAGSIMTLLEDPSSDTNATKAGGKSLVSVSLAPGVFRLKRRSPFWSELGSRE